MITTFVRLASRRPAEKPRESQDATNSTGPPDVASEIWAGNRQAVAESRKRSLAERFARVLARLKLEYDLELDVVVEAERQLRSRREN